MPSTPDEIGLVETAYRLDLEPRAYFQKLAAEFERLFPAAIDMFVYRHWSGEAGDPWLESYVGPQWVADVCWETMTNESLPPGMFEHFHHATRLMSVSDESKRIGVDHLERPLYRDYFAPNGIFDMIGVNAANPNGAGVVISALLDRVVSPSHREARVFTRIAIHIAAALRLRDALEGEDPLTSPDAVLSPGGRIEHAEEPVKSRINALRDAVKRRAFAQREARHDPERALELWQGLVHGTWSLVDHFDTDGRRFLVARKNDPQVRDPRALTRRERQAVHYAGVHGSNKLIGYELGLSASTVSTLLQRAQRKLGLRSRAELIRVAGSLATSDES